MTRAVVEMLGADPAIWCPGCKCLHKFDARWTWNGDTERPTFTPSFLSHESGDVPRCHSFVTDGVIRFLADCTHELAGKSVALEAP